MELGSVGKDRNFKISSNIPWMNLIISCLNEDGQTINQPIN